MVKKKKYTLRGSSEIAILMGVMVFALLVGGALITIFRDYAIPFVPNPSLGICCDSGDGNNCHPIVDSAHPTAAFKSPEEGMANYGLLKSNITIEDCAKHLKDSGMVGPNNEPIIYDTSNQLAQKGITEVCNSPWGDLKLDVHMDTLADYRSGQKYCFPIPNDEIIYLCKYHCYPAPNGNKNCDPLASDYYGDGTTIYDVYFRLKDYSVPRTKNPDTTSNGVPDVIKNCAVPTIAWDPSENQQNQCLNPSAPVAQRLSPVAYPSHASLQLHTFPFGVTGVQCPQQWIRPWCKPAIYIYPPGKQQMTVKIAPQGKIKALIPNYSQNGWQVTAYPDGHVETGGKSYPYLYYAASIPDELVPTQTTGYVAEYSKLNDLFSTLLPKLGLNTKETQDFSTYWLKALPKSPYYLVSIIPQSTLNNITPLYFNPVPETIIRVTLNFKALDKKIDIKAPNLPNVVRKGFTVSEWGGMVQTDPNNPFTCLE